VRPKALKKINFHKCIFQISIYKKINTKTKKTIEKEKECKKQAVHFALLFNFAAQRPDKLLSKFEMARLAKGDIFRQTFATCLCEITN